MLARTIGARATKDIDLLSRQNTLGDALGELLRSAEVDLDDHMRSVYVDSKPIKAEDEYHFGLKVSFVPWIGPKKR